MDLALSFQEKSGCAELWEKICRIQGKDPETENEVLFTTRKIISLANGNLRRKMKRMSRMCLATAGCPRECPISQRIQPSLALLASRMRMRRQPFRPAISKIWAKSNRPSPIPCTPTASVKRLPSQSFRTSLFSKTLPYRVLANSPLSTTLDLYYSYIPKLCELFAISEDLENKEALHQMASIAKNLFLLNNNAMLNELIDEKHFRLCF